MVSGRRLPQVVALILALTGLCVSVYLTVVHYATTALVCTTSGAVNCELVLSSAYAVIAGSPITTSMAGILWFAVAAAIAFARWRAPAARRLAMMQLAWSAIGLAVVLGLVFIEIVALGAICLWCTTAHVLVVLTFLIAISTMGDLEPEVARR